MINLLIAFQKEKNKTKLVRDFPGRPVVKTPPCNGTVLRFDPWLGN